MTVKVIVIKQLEVKKQKAKICTTNISYLRAQASWTNLLHSYTVSLCSFTLILHSISSRVWKTQYQVSQIKVNA